MSETIVEKTVVEITGQVRDLPKDVEKTRTIPFVISSGSKDRHGTVLNMDNWNLENFNKNPIVGYQHNVYGGDLCSPADPDDVIGIGKAWLEDGNLLGSVKFETADINPKADKIFKKVLAGTLRATSVGFMPLVNDAGEQGQYGRMDPTSGQIVDKETYFYYGQELLEFSIVNIPSNPEAIRKSLRSQTTDAIGYLYRQLKGEYRFSEIEKMTIGSVMNLLENPVKKQIEKKVEKQVEKGVKKEITTSPDDKDLILTTTAEIALNNN